MNHYVHVYRTNIDGFDNKVVRYCCQNPNFRYICIQRPLKILSRKLLPAHWLENRDDQPRTVGVSNYIQVHCSHAGPHLGTLVPMGTKISFLVPIWSPFFFKVPIFSILGLRTRQVSAATI